VNRRRMLLFAALAGTLSLVWYVSQNDAEPEGAHAAVATSLKPPRPVRLPSRPPVSAASGPVRGVADVDPFPVQSWRPPPPPPPPAAPPPPPSPPPLPFSYLGAWQDGGHQAYFFTRGDGEFGLHLGEQTGPWRLDKAGADQLVFTYLPLNMQRTMRLLP
jgi:hypothetical protein